MYITAKQKRALGCRLYDDSELVDDLVGVHRTFMQPGDFIYDGQTFTRFLRGLMLQPAQQFDNFFSSAVYVMPSTSIIRIPMFNAILNRASSYSVNLYVTYEHGRLFIYWPR
jgi:hypothetical protein